MTIIKQRAVSSVGHGKNLRGYINDDRKVLLRDSQNMERCKDVKRWAWFMSRTRDKFGHNKSARVGKDGKPVPNTILYHQILGFNPDECDVNGGQLSPEDCMRYAKEYARTYYPNQEVVFALHNEYCKEDGTHRYAVHMVINRTDLVTGKRLDEGLSRKAKAVRAKRVREMDERWGLRAVERDKGNVMVHKRQPSKLEREIAERGGESYKTNLRELCRLAATRATDVVEYRDLLDRFGVETEFRGGRMYATDRDNARYAFSVSRLDTDLDSDGLGKRFDQNARHRYEAAHPEAALDAKRRAYLADIERTYLDYRKAAHAMKGAPIGEIPKLRLKRPPEEVAQDPEVRRTILAYWRGADELRRSVSSRKSKAGRTYGAGAGSASHPQEQTRGHDGERTQERTDTRGEER